MAHPLELKISQVRSQARRLLALYAAARWAAVVTVSLIVAVLADYWIRFEDHGIRLMASLGVLAVAGWATHRFWIVGLRRGLDDVQIARRIERRFPALRDRLASTVQFLKQSEADITAGSAELRRAVIDETTSAAEGLDFSDVFERRPVRRVLLVGGLAAAVAAALVLVFPSSAQLGLARLARPFGDDAWPRFYHVEFRQPPTRLAVGQPFEVELIADKQHRVPDDVRIHYRYETGTATIEEEVEPMQKLNGAVVARKEHVSRPFAYRADGGDDRSMDWIALEVVEPPRLESLSLSLHPPAYTGLPVEPSEKSIHALRGTRVELAGTSTKKLKTAELHQENGPTLSAELSADGYAFSLAADADPALVIDKSGPWWIELEDGEGLKSGADQRWDIRAVADLAPTVTIEQPAGNIFVTPQGEVPLVIAAKDDLAIYDMALHFSRSDRTDIEDFVVPLYGGPEHATAPAAGTTRSERTQGDSRTVEHRWNMADLNVKSGTRLTFWATAGDYLPQVGKSTARTLTVITKAELEDRLAQRQSLILGELQRVLKLQQDARGQTQSLEIQLDNVGRFNTHDIDNAQSAELNQRQVARTLTSPAEGVPAQIADFLADLASNRVDSPDIERHMNAILAELERLGRDHLTTIEQELTSVIKASQANRPGDNPVQTAKADPLLKKSLHAAGENQDQVIASLESMVAQLGQWDNYRRFAREIAQLQHDQQEAARDTAALGQKTLGKDLKDLDPQQQADLKKLVNQQTELGRRLEKIQQQMGQMTGALQQSDPLSAATITDGLHHAQQQAISGQMRQASQRLEKNQLGQAAALENQIVKDLDDLMGILSNRREQELTRLVKQLREAERELSRIRSKQSNVHRQMAEAARGPNADSPQTKKQLERFAREEKRLQEDAARLARRLERLQAEQAGRSTAGAAGRMASSGTAGEQGDAAAAAAAAEQAEKDLEEASQQLAERRKAAEEDLAHEQLARLEDSLKSLHDRQVTLIAETDRLEKLRAAEGRFSRAQASTVHDLARGQKSLAGETSVLAEKLALSELITLALGGAAMQMARAADLLDQQRTDGPTRGAQEAAALRFAQLLSAFENKSKPGGDQAGQQGGEGEGEGEGGKRPDGGYVLAQLKLIKILQEDLNGRFRTLTKGDDQQTAAARELAQIAADQGKLAELALKLSESPEPNPEDNPDKLPDVRQGGQPPSEVDLLEKEPS